MLKPQEWESVIETIASGSTILCLGAELFSTAGKTLDEQLGEELAGLDNVHLYGDGLFHLKGSGHMTSYTKIKQFFNRDFPALAPVMEQLAQLPISVVVNTTPDRSFQKACVKLGLPFQYDYHHPNKPAREPEEPRQEEPYLYNLMGDLDRRESMVLTHEDLFGFMESLMEGKSMPRVLRQTINTAYSFIFLGLPFGKWHMKVLLHFLQKDTNKQALKHAANEAFDTEVQSFMVDQFQITCVPTNIGDFTGELYRLCAERGILRSAAAPPPKLSRFEKWTKMVLEDELDPLIEELVAYFSQHFAGHTENLNHLFNLGGRLSSVERMVQRGTIAQEDAHLQRNQIRDAILDFLQDTVKPLST